jgi:hypothetical protein
MAAPFPAPKISTGKESLSMPSEDARQTCVVLGLGLLLTGVNALYGML